MDSRRILILITDLKIGGMPSIVREVARRLHQPPEVRVDVSCLAPWGPVADQIAALGIAVHPLDARRPAEFPFTVRRLVNLIRRGGYDTVFSCLVHANATAAAASLLLPDVRFVQCIQTTQPTPRWHWRAQAIAHHAAEAMVVPSASVARAVQEWSGVPRSKIIIIPNGVEPAEFAGLSEPIDEACEDSTTPQTRRRAVGFVGRLDPIKRIPDLLQAVDQLAGKVHLHVFGDGAEREAIRAKVEELGIENLVTLHGSVPRPHEAFEQIELLVLPSAAEGFPMVVIEAMAAGVPVIGTDVPGIRDAIVHGRTGLLVPPGSPGQLAEAIDEVLYNPRLRRALRAEAQRDVAERFSWESIIPQYRKVLRIPQGAVVG